MLIRKQLIKRTIAGDVILVPVGDASLELKGLLTLNETGERIWDMLPQCADKEELIWLLLDEYDIDESTLRADVDEFLARLMELNIL